MCNYIYFDNSTAFQPKKFRRMFWSLWKSLSHSHTIALKLKCTEYAQNCWRQFQSTAASWKWLATSTCSNPHNGYSQKSYRLQLQSSNGSLPLHTKRKKRRRYKNRIGKSLWVEKGMHTSVYIFIYCWAVVIFCRWYGIARWYE